ncbi:MAG TPA: hypothetical protein VMD99_13195 [Terriglobales bacterium]|nr:hypothetical protein [Terriglobales bacterium]
MGKSNTVSIPYLDPNVQYVGISRLRAFNATQLKELDKTLVIQDNDKPLAVLVKYEHLLAMQDRAGNAWEYAHAIYKDGILDPHIGEGLAEIGHDSVGQFLREAGQRGWELCGMLPYPSSNKSSDGTQAAIFKRPIAVKEQALAQAQGRKAH